jgi:hypothetical protein
LAQGLHIKSYAMFFVDRNPTIVSSDLVFFVILTHQQTELNYNAGLHCQQFVAVGRFINDCNELQGNWCFASKNGNMI